MSEPVSYSPSQTFKDAAAFLSSASTLSGTSNETKLELYGIYKLLTVSPEPGTSRPSIFFPTDRAKYDAWKSAGSSWRKKEAEAEVWYLEIAGSLGWTPASTEPGPYNRPAEPERTVEELLADEDDSSNGAGNGMGPSISVIKRDEIVEDQSLHTIAIKGDTQELDTFLEKNQDTDLNSLDDYGFTALHLACDRGHVAMVEQLLQKGADRSLKDSDGLSALDLALEAEHGDIVALLRNSS